MNFNKIYADLTNMYDIDYLTGDLLNKLFDNNNNNNNNLTLYLLVIATADYNTIYYILDRYKTKL
jgi:hypothetical protein